MSPREAVERQVELLRSGYDIGVYPDGYVPLLCNECDTENFKFSCVNDTGYDQINMVRLGVEEPFHRASLLGFNSDEGPQWFLVDPTYGQFFENEKFKNYMFQNDNEFTWELLKNGFVPCTLENMASYMSGFVFSGAYTNDVDHEKVYRNVERLLISNGIAYRVLSSGEVSLLGVLEEMRNASGTSVKPIKK